MERPKNIIETKEYTEPHTFESDKEATLFYAYIESEKYIDYLLESTTKLIEIEKRKYAVEVLESLIFSDSLLKGKKEPILSTLVIVNITTKNTIKLLEQQIKSLENELK